MPKRIPKPSYWKSHSSGLLEPILNPVEAYLLHHCRFGEKIWRITYGKKNEAAKAELLRIDSIDNLLFNESVRDVIAVLERDWPEGVEAFTATGDDYEYPSHYVCSWITPDDETLKSFQDRVTRWYEEAERQAAEADAQQKQKDLDELKRLRNLYPEEFDGPGVSG